MKSIFFIFGLVTALLNQKPQNHLILPWLCIFTNKMVLLLFSERCYNRVINKVEKLKRFLPRFSVLFISCLPEVCILQFLHSAAPLEHGGLHTLP